ncbi:MAG: type II secretion system F family protein, partial [Candidatus Eremiobacteraeota bacterium]|nr:type II secretion system F family protein [Candidatus Eremiobacteraeota bacterium]
TRQLAVLLGSGMELRQSLEALSAGAGNEDLRAVLTRILHCIDSGWNISNSLKQFPRIFDQVYISMVEVGEETGSISECLHGLANWLDSEEHLIRDVKSGLYYPITVLVVAFCLTVFFLTVIFPGFSESLSFGDAIPFPTRVLMTASSLMLNPLFWLGSIVAVALLVRSARAFLTQGDNRARLFGVFLHLPVLGPVLRDVGCSRFCAAFGILQNSGVDMLKSFKLAILASGSPQASIHLREGVNTIISGGKMSDYLREHPEAFSRIMVDLITVGEDAARLPETCFKLQELLEADARYSLEVLTSLLEPVLMVFISLVVGTLIICTALPMYNQIMNGL